MITVMLGDKKEEMSQGERLEKIPTDMTDDWKKEVLTCIENALEICKRYGNDEKAVEATQHLDMAKETLTKESDEEEDETLNDMEKVDEKKDYMKNIMDSSKEEE